MTKWAQAVETILTAYKTETGIPYDFERIDVDTAQLPDTYIVYFLVNDRGASYADGKQRSHEQLIQVSLFYRDKSVFLNVPDQIEAAFTAANFMRAASGAIPYQKDTGHYGWYRKFTYYEER